MIRENWQAGTAVMPPDQEAGIEPLDAVLVKTPRMAPIFGWADERAELAGLVQQVQAATSG